MLGDRSVASPNQQLGKFDELGIGQRSQRSLDLTGRDHHCMPVDTRMQGRQHPFSDRKHQPRAGPQRHVCRRNNSGPKRNHLVFRVLHGNVLCRLRCPGTDVVSVWSRPVWEKVEEGGRWPGGA